MGFELDFLDGISGLIGRLAPPDDECRPFCALLCTTSKLLGKTHPAELDRLWLFGASD